MPLLKTILFLSCAAFSIAQPTTPYVFSVANTANYSGTVAQGSMFIVFGGSLGPAQLVQAGTYPLNNQLAGTSITVMSGTAILPCPMVYTSMGVAAAILPSNTPPGTATLSLTYNGQPTPFPATFTVVPSAVGIYTTTSSGVGPGVFTALDGTEKSFAISAKPNDAITAWATGLGPIAGPDNVVPSTFPNFPNVQVFVGSLSANVIYAGRSGCCAGVDQISFVVPAGISGCYVPVVVSSQGVFSNFVSLAITTSGGPCSDTGPVLPVNIANQANAGQNVKIAALAVGPVSALRGLGFNTRIYLTAKLSSLLHVTVAPDDVDKLLRAGQTHDQRALKRVLAKYGAAWKTLDRAGRDAVSQAISAGQEGVVADFGQFNSPAALAAALGGLFPSQGTCTVPNLNVSSRGDGPLDAGPSLSLSGQSGSWTLMPSSAGEYQAIFGSTPIGPNVPPGTYTISSGGGQDVGSFSASLTVIGNVTWTNKASISTVDRTQPVTVTWSGATQPGTVLIGGYSQTQTEERTFTCVEDASKGTFTIPSFVLSQMPATTGGTLFISPHPLSHQVSIPGLDLAYFVDASSQSKTVSYH